MDHFGVYKDLCLFLRKVYLKEIYSDKTPLNDLQLDTRETEALESLMILMEEGGQSSGEEEAPEMSGWKRDPKLKIRSTKMPLFRKNKWLGVFLDLVEEDLKKLNWETIMGDNLTYEERKALKELREADQVIIKKSDKGGNVVLLSVDFYEGEVRRLLNDESTYKRLHHDPFQDLVELINEKLQWAFEANLISKKELEFLRVVDFNKPTFYIIPKVHKNRKVPPGRPIVSAIRGPLERLGKYIDSLIKDMVLSLTSYVRDTGDVLNKISALEFPEGALLVGIDVESLYTSIPHEWGILAVYHFLEKHFPEMGAQNEFIIDLLELALKHNFFQFSGSNYQQLRGTSMGAPWAPAYACLHLGWWEEEKVYASSMYLGHACCWLRYIDDVLMVWAGTSDELEVFMAELENNTRNIHLTYTADPHQLSFLDLSIRLEGGRLITSTFRKETAANTLLQADSHHPKSLIRGIPVGQFMRIRRNCSTEEDYFSESKQLYQRFRERGYPHRTLKRAMSIAGHKRRADLLLPQKKTQQETEGLVRFITPYGSQWHQVNTILSKHWHILLRAVGSRQIIGERPSMVAKRAQNLNDMLVQSEFVRPSNRSWLTDMPRVNGMFPCGHCGTCKYVDRSKTFRNSDGSQQFEIRSFINCATTRILYVLECPCHKLYVGKTKRQLRVRFGEHLKSIRLKEETSVAQHFLDFHQGKTTGLRVKGFYALSLTDRRGDFDRVLLRKEKKWIFRLGTLQPNGLNHELSLSVFLEP